MELLRCETRVKLEEDEIVGLEIKPIPQKLFHGIYSTLICYQCSSIALSGLSSDLQYTGVCLKDDQDFSLVIIPRDPGFLW